MPKSQPKKIASRTGLHRPSPAEIRRAATQARQHAATLTDRALKRAIAADADTAEAEPTRLILVRPDDLDVARIRSGLGLTQAAFAAATGISHRLISDWEQGRKKSSAAARAFLLVDEFGDKALKRLARRAAA
jgi:DNA-binding transcriptional regulator YiaG